MKKIEITVADDVVGTIIALIAEHAQELHVTSVDAPTDITKKKEKRRTVAKVVRGIGGKTIEQHLLAWMGDATVHRDEINKYIAGLGYGANSGASCVSKLVDKKLVARVGNKSFKVIDALGYEF